MAKPLRILISKLKALFVRPRTPTWKIVIPESGLVSHSHIYHNGKEIQATSVTVTLDARSHDAIARMNLVCIARRTEIDIEGNASLDAAS